VKTGWWEVCFKLTLEGEEVELNTLSEITREHITKCIREGYRQGEIVEDDEPSDEDSVDDWEEPVCGPCTDTSA
jgi:hypothetical protein